MFSWKKTDFFWESKGKSKICFHSSNVFSATDVDVARRPNRRLVSDSSKQNRRHQRAQWNAVETPYGKCAAIAGAQVKKKKTSMESRQNSNRNSVEHGQVHGRPTGLSSVREARQKRRVGRRRSVCVRCVDLFCRGRRRRRRTLGNRTSTTGV